MGLAASNKTVDTTVKVPVTTTDFSSTVSNAKNADCIISILPEQALNQYLAKATSLGVKQWRCRFPPGRSRRYSAWTTVRCGEAAGTQPC